MSETIPEWARQAAIEAAGPEHCFADVVERFALALLARDERAAKEEREACAKLAETHTYYEIGDRWMLASAIRDRSKT